METIKNLIARVNNTKEILHVRYPEILDKEKINIVYVSPFFNKQGLYRMILPSLELKEAGGYSTLVTNVLDEDPTKIIDDVPVQLSKEIIRYADYMVFQANGQDMQSLIMEIKSINPKCKVVLDVDRIYHSINPNNYTAKKFTLDKIRNLEKNIELVDFSTYPDLVTEEFYKKKCNPNIKTFILPNLLSPFQFEGVNTKAERPKHNDKYRVLLLGEQDDWDDINSFRDTINQIMIRVPNCKVYALSNSLVYENKNCLRLVDYKRVPYTDMSEYYSILWNMNPDLAIIPVKKQSYYRTYYKLLELGSFGVPIISINNEYPFNHLLKKDVHIILAGQKKSFVASVAAACENPEIRQKLSKAIQPFIRERYSFLNESMLDVYKKVFK